MQGVRRGVRRLRGGVQEDGRLIHPQQTGHSSSAVGRCPNRVTGCLEDGDGRSTLCNGRMETGVARLSSPARFHKIALLQCADAALRLGPLLGGCPSALTAAVGKNASQTPVARGGETDPGQVTGHRQGPRPHRARAHRTGR